MNIKEMHYDFKLKLNAIDTQLYSGFKIPEIDWLLNRAIEVYIKLIAFPRTYTARGFEINRRTIDDLFPLVVNYKTFDSSGLEKFDESSYIYKYPEDYWFFLSGYVNTSKSGCNDKIARLWEVQHDDLNEECPFSESSFEWKEVNVLNINEGFRLFAHNFDIKGIKLNYLKKHPYMHNAEDYSSSGYTSLKGDTLTGTQDCILPESTHPEIVDVAVLLATNSLTLNTKLTNIGLVGNVDVN